MLKYIDNSTMGQSSADWLNSIHHFSFSSYYNPENINFGVLRVVNDDLVKENTGFDTHPHKNMEILTYVVDGELTHSDSMGNSNTLTRGQIQYMSAGTGVLHSEHNYGNGTLRFLQIWIFPDNEGYTPNYGDKEFNWNDRVNKWLPLVSGDDDKKFPIQIHADVHVYVTEITKSNSLDFKLNLDRQAYLIQIEGTSSINDITLNAKDALEITDENIIINATEDSHIMIIEMKKS